MSITDLKQTLGSCISQDELVKLTMDLIAIPSCEGVPGQETAACQYIKEVFDREGIQCRIDPLQDGRSNVIAILPGEGRTGSADPAAQEAAGRSLLLNGHIDTVPGYDMEDPFTPRIAGTDIYGRGASDMKGPVASMIGAMIALKRSGIKLAGDVLFSGVADEEHQSIGTIDLLEHGLAGRRVDGAIVGEPTDLKVCTAHRGLEWYEFHFIGKTVHGGHQDEGINAISKAVHFIRALEDDLIPRVYAKKHPLLESATLNVGVIHGGTQLSTVAGECSVFLDRRFLPAENYDDVNREFTDLLDRLAAEDPTFRCEMKVTDDSIMKEGYVHLPMETALDHPLVQTLQTTVEAATGESPVMSFFPAWTDGGLLSGYGHIPTVVLGPGHIACCHSADEHIPMDHLMKAALCYALTAVQFCI